jgi:hypothetical protein
LDGIEYTLVTASTFFIDKNDKRVKTNVVEIHVASESADSARENLSIAWGDKDFLADLETCHGLPIMFIPSIQHGVISVETYREALSQQHEQAKNVVSISVEGIAGLDADICLRNGDKTTLSQLVLTLEDSNGKKLFSGIEPTKFTYEQGRYLFLTTKSSLDEAEAQFDKLTMDLANEGLLAALQIDGMFIRRRSKIQSKPVASYAERLKAKFKPPVPTVSVQSNRPSQTRNAWNRTPTLKAKTTFQRSQLHLVVTHRKSSVQKVAATPPRKMIRPSCPPRSVPRRLSLRMNVLRCKPQLQA